MPTSRSKSRARQKKDHRIGITLGDPGGIGPQIVARALKKEVIRRLGSFIVIGDEALFKKWGINQSSRIQLIDCHQLKTYRQIKNGVATANGKAAYQYLRTACQLLKDKQIDRLVTAPVAKEAIAKSQPGFVGHTEFFAKNFGIKHVEMMFVHENFRVVIATRHVPLKKIPRRITKKTVLRTIRMTNKALKELFKIRRARLAVCGLNPHAGEAGLIGKEEKTHIIPAIRQARKEKIKVDGPFAADTLFTPPNQKKFDAFIAMYHDQGLIPAKTLYFDTLVNLTVGLPFIRTSPDHGTAFDIAGSNKADPSSMIEAIKLAARL